MDINTTYWFFNKVKNDSLCLLYNGTISDKLTMKFIKLSEYNITKNVELSKMRKRTSFLMAECYQNIVRHTDTKDIGKDSIENIGFFSTKNIGNTYFIASGNIIDKKNISKLKEQINQVNSLDKEQLKKLFMKVLDTQELSSKGGAGLGLIEMARKSGHKIEFLFKEFNNNFSFFYNQITLSKEKDELGFIDKNQFSIDESISLHEKMNDEKILLVQKGDFSQESILPVLSIVEQNMVNSSSTIDNNREVYHVLVELLQNIAKHSLKINQRNEGIFLVGKVDKHTIVSAGNYVEINKVADFERKLKKIQSLNKEELRELYLKELKYGTAIKGEGAGIGLIDIAQQSLEPILYFFHKVDSEKVFFTIYITI